MSTRVSEIVAALLLPILGLLVLGGQMVGQMAETRYPDATGVAGEVLAGHSLGQTFIAQHDGLSAVDLLLATYARANSGDLVLHLRHTVTETADLATVRVSAAGIANNGWQRFGFPVQAGSRGQAYYVELEHPGAAPGNAITAYWRIGAGDPYPYGRATHDRAPLDGDLAFGLVYQASPALVTDVFGTLAGQIPGRWLLLLAALAAAGLLGLILWGTARNWWAGMVRRRLALGGLLGAFALAHGGVWMLTIPPWQGPDEFAHYAYSALLAQGVDPNGRDPAALAARRRIEAGVLASMDAWGFTRTVSWYATPGGPAANFVQPPGALVTSLFIETRQPSLYYQVGALALRLYSADPAGLPADIGLYLVRAGSVALGALSVLLAWGLALLLAPGPRLRLLWVALPLILALLPMRVFIDSMANNDVLAEAGVAALAVAVAGWLRAGERESSGQRAAGSAEVAGAGFRHSALRPVVWGILATGLAGASLLTKTSTTIAAAPGLWIGGLIAGVVLALRRRGRRAAWGWGVLALLGLGGLAGGALVLAVSLDPASAALAWNQAGGIPARRIGAPPAYRGGYSLDLPANRRVDQIVDLPPSHPAYQISFGVRARSTTGTQAGATLTLETDQGVISTTRVLLPPADPTADTDTAWHPITVTGVIAAGFPYVVCKIQSPTALLVDEASFTAARLPAEGGAPAPEVRTRLRNPSFESAATTVRPGSPLDALLGRLPGTVSPESMLETLLNPQRFDKGAVVGSFLDNQYRSYWGWYGWLGVPQQIPAWQFMAWTLLVLGAGVGWGLAAWERRLAAPWWALAALTLTALAAAIGTGVLRQMTDWALYNLQAFPQGRYLFVLILPATWLLITGLGAAGAFVARRLPGLSAAGRTRLVPRAAWVGLWLLVYLDLYPLVVLLIPYYYGRF